MNEKDFKLEDIFYITSSKGIYHANKITIYKNKITNSHPYIVRQTVDNGRRGFIIGDESKLNEGNCISYAGDTSITFYQKESFFTGSNVKCLRLKDHELNLNLGLYLITAINKALSKYTWGISCKLNKELIKLPVDDEGNIDWEYMENYIEELKRECVPAYINRLNNQKVNDADIDILNKQVEYKDFKIKDLFDIEMTKGKYDSNKIIIYNNQITNSHPYIVRQTTNNGRRGFIIGDESKLNEGNCISFGHDTWMTFYQTDSFFTGDKVKCLRLKDYELNLNLGLYFTTVMNKALSKYSWGISCKIEDVLIKLPINNEGNPDYEYMDKYIQALRKQNESFVDRKINKLREFVGEEE